MTDRELKKLSRTDLLELLLDQMKENERLRAELDTAQAQLADRRILLDEAGSIAEAALRLNGVFQAAEAACAQYIENIKRLGARADAETPPKPDRGPSDAGLRSYLDDIGLDDAYRSLWDDPSGTK